ncbi:MAG TPA: hypothetical protein VLN42_11920 [Casimicrobiaceae bacterium]|nr:hypothetical protein [Casimicrobiaceae bacterium]
MAEAQGQVGGGIVARAGRAHETADVDAKRVWQTAAVLAATIVGAGFVAYGVLALFHHEIGRPLTPINPPPTAMPSPPLQSAPTLDLAALRAQKHAMLGEYRWIDRDKGIVRIPIERAMALLIARTPPKR